ncbi:MAG TPA: CaiB/BaiF CoA-transferase family protein [Steroidobacteraceae bacterium]|nr:CaiB/BaiF CoA-transferase family protein [Steroidobacteraceae bacterium]
MAGPLAGLRVLELVSIGPGPHCAMLLADLGAEVLRIDRPGGNGWPNPIVDRGRHVITLDVREPAGRDRCLQAARQADVLIEGMRPGVMERLGLGPDPMLKSNPRLVYARMTGWGQTGPLAQAAGHDLNFIALTGALAAIGPQSGSSVPPLNLVGDFGGGSMLLAFGIMAALWERERSGKGQVLDCAIVDGVASMMTMFAGLVPSGALSLDRGRRLLGGDAPFYRCYTCADGAQIAVGALEPKFYRELLDRIGAPQQLHEDQYESGDWARRCELLATLFLAKSRSHWCEILEGTDACFAPVLTLAESPHNPHLRARQTYVEVNGAWQAAAAPRFSRTPGEPGASGSGEELLARWGVTAPPHRD